MTRWPRRGGGPRALLAVLAAVAVAGVTGMPSPAIGDDEPPGGTDISLPLTDSAATVSGRGTFGDMEFTINQTENLTSQAISITWEGGVPSVAHGINPFMAHFVQIMQCWGEPDDLVPENPGPPPEKCVWGALNPTAQSELDGFHTKLVTSRIISHESWAAFDPDVGTVDESGEVYRDFIAVDGTVVTDHVDHTATGLHDEYWQNPEFNSVTSNELPGARTLSDGTGQTLFTVNTGLDLGGLGCGQRVEPTSSGEPKEPRCWLVIVPRGAPEVENEGARGFETRSAVATGPMRPKSWENRIAVELDFTPIDSPCDIASDQRLISGNELPVGALSSWQPVLCTQPGLLPFAYSVASDQLARRQVLSDSEGSPGLVAVNRPLPDGEVTDDDPVLYAPLTISAATIGFNVERVLSQDTIDTSLQWVRFSKINLTPRLVAKLLTQSYRSQVEIRLSDPFYEDVDTGEQTPYTWHVDNPRQMLSDPDFLQFNPEFDEWQTGSIKHGGGLVLPAGTSDLATQVWEWVLADPEAAAWLAGEPDEFGMVVNPYYRTDADTNPAGVAFAAEPPDSFPKSDPYCYQSRPTAISGVVPPEMCGIDWFPYADNLATAASHTAAATDGAKDSLDHDAPRPLDAWQRSGPQTFGRRTLFGLTDVPSAFRYGIQTARLSRAGDNGPDREFVAPDETSMSHALGSMDSNDGVLRLDPLAVAEGAYPLTMVTHAAVRPLALDEEAREDFAAFLDHAAGPGQEPGLDLGQLPPGYLPLPASLAQAAEAVADQVRTLEPPAEPPPAPTTTTTTTTTAPPVVSSEEGAEPPGPGSAAPPAPTPGATPAAPSTAAATPAAGSGEGGAGVNGDDAGDEDTAAAASPDTDAPSDERPTPIAALGNGRFTLAALAGLAVLCALGALEVQRGVVRRLVARSAST